MAGPQTSSTPLVYPSNMVYIDTVNGVSLNPSVTPTLIGTASLPVNNLADAIFLAAQRLTNNFHVKNILTLNRNLAPNVYNFFGDGDWWVSIVDLNNNDVNNSSFNGLGVVGNSPGFVWADDCFIGSVNDPSIFSMFDGNVTRSIVASFRGKPIGVGTNFLDCIAYGPPFLLSLSGGGAIGWGGGAGELDIDGMDDPASLLILQAITGGVYFEPTCVDGAAGVGDVGFVHDFSAGTFIRDFTTYHEAKASIQSFNITSHANAGDVVIGTCSDVSGHMGIAVEKVVLRSNGLTTGDLISAAIYGEVGNVVTMINAATATQAALNAAGKQVNSTGGPWTIRDGSPITISLLGNPPGAHVDLTVDIFFRPLYDGARLR